MNIKLIIFDLDGTLLDTLNDLAQSVNHALQRNGFPEHPLESFRYFVGNGVTKLIERALPEQARTPDTIAHIRTDFKTYYSLHNRDYTQPYVGIPSLLASLRGLGITLAVASNKYQSATEELVAHYFGDSMFAVVLGQREGLSPKPDPTIVFDILNKTGFSAEESIYIGDSKVDMQTAARSGLYSVGVTWGFRPRSELEAYGAGKIIDVPGELLDLVSI